MFEEPVAWSYEGGASPGISLSGIVFATVVSRLRWGKKSEKCAFVENAGSINDKYLFRAWQCQCKKNAELQ